MTSLYFLGLAVLVIAGYFLGRSRALTAGHGVPLHSRPIYHGAFVVISVLIPMLLIFLVAVPIADSIVNSQAISTLDSALLDDEPIPARPCQAAPIALPTSLDLVEATSTSLWRSRSMRCPKKSERRRHLTNRSTSSAIRRGSC